MRRAHSHGLISSGSSIGNGVAKSKNCGVRILWCITKKYKKRRYKMFVWVRRCRTLKACLRCRLAETVLVLLLRGCCFCRGRLHSLASPYNGIWSAGRVEKDPRKKKGEVVDKEISAPSTPSRLCEYVVFNRNWQLRTRQSSYSFCTFILAPTNELKECCYFHQYVLHMAPRVLYCYMDRASTLFVGSHV